MTAGAPRDAAFYSREYNNRELVPDNERWVEQWLQGSARARCDVSAQREKYCA